MTAQNNTEALLQVLLTQTLLDLERCTQEQSARDRDNSSCRDGRTMAEVCGGVALCECLFVHCVCVDVLRICCGYHELAAALLCQ